MAPPSPAPDLTRLLRELGSEVRRAAEDPREARADLATGLPAVDALLGGGLARGRLSELSGPLSSGRTSLALALLARATASGEVVAWVDGADAFHPASARAAGVRLERVLWTQPPGAAEAVRCTERLLQARGFAAVVLDTGAREAEWEKLPAAVWQRLVRAASAGGSALVVLSGRRTTGSFADVALELLPSSARFSGAPSLFEGIEIEAAIARHRRGRPCRPAAVRLRAAAE
jgi:hypothetical protein